ncbi:unnamed protein product [Ectocarpus sp. 12 AP-2014]
MAAAANDGPGGARDTTSSATGRLLPFFTIYREEGVERPLLSEVTLVRDSAAIRSPHREAARDRPRDKNNFVDCYTRMLSMPEPFLWWHVAVIVCRRPCTRRPPLQRQMRSRKLKGAPATPNPNPVTYWCLSLWSGCYIAVLDLQ